jgi:DNA-binding NtrC family response regulator
MTPTLKLHAPSPETATASVMICTADAALAECLATHAAAVRLTPLQADEPGAVLANGAIDVCVVGPDWAESAVRAVAAQLEQDGRTTQIVRIIADSSDSAFTGQNVAWDLTPWEILQAPLTDGRVRRALFAAAERARLLSENRRLKRQLAQRGLREMVGRSPSLQALRERVQSAAQSDEPVLICGEPGTGTNLVAHAIHDSSRRAHRPLLRLNAHVFSAEALDRELFGDESAESESLRLPSLSENLFPTACATVLEGGTLFLDHVDALALPLQKKLLHAFHCWRAPENAGGKRVFDCRVIAATHADLSALIERRLFRPELFQYLAAVPIATPALRDCREDIGLLAEHILNRLMLDEGAAARRISVDALELLESYDWPGNVRELEAVIRSACALDRATRLTARSIRPWLGWASAEGGDSFGLSLKEMERKLIEATFARCRGNRESTAQTLQIGLRTLSGKLREYGYPPRGGPGSNLKASKKKAA